MSYHPLCTAFPDLPEAEFEALCESIQAFGQRDPIVAKGLEILDGKNRHRACMKLGIPPLIRQYDPQTDGPSIAQFVADKNLHRRNLTTSQRAAIAVELEKQIIADREAGLDAGKSRARDAAADAVGVSSATVAQAKKVSRENPQALEDMKAGKITLEQAKKQTPPDDARKHAADQLAIIHGDKFAQGVRDGSLLPGKCLNEFLALPEVDQQQIRPLVESGWQPKQAYKFDRGLFTGTDTLQDLANFAAYKQESVRVRIDAATITIEPD